MIVTMSAQHPSRRYKGGPLCHPNKARGLGRKDPHPFAVLRQVGKRRRVSRGDLGL